MPVPGLLNGKVALVTGCARGIGAATCRILAASGARVVGADIDAAAGAQMMDEIDRATCRATFVRLDIADTDAVTDVTGQIARDHGGLDILVNNASLTRVVPFLELGPDDWNPIIDVNLKGTLAMMQAGARLMIGSGGGSIVNVASIAGKGYVKTTNIAYAASKGAMIAMTRVAAYDLGRKGIRVNAVCPGPTETEIMTNWLAERAAALGQSVEALKADVFSESALGTTNRPEDVGDTILYLVSDMSRTITGQSVNVDGGILWD